MLAFGFCGVFISQFVRLLVVCSSLLCDVNCLAAAGAEQSSGSGDKVPPPRPPPPRVQQPVEGWFSVVSQALPVISHGFTLLVLCTLTMEFTGFT